VASLNRPGGNVTGVSWFSNLIAGKGLGLLHELVPNASVIAMLVNPKLPESARMQSEGHEAARTLGRQLLALNASSASEIDAAFATMRERRAGALLVGADPFSSSRTQQIVALAARDAIPAMYSTRESIEEGGLMTYGSGTADGYVAPESTWGEFSMVPRPPTCRSIRPPSSNSSSMSKPRKRSALRFPNPFSPAPTR
jgi:putative ABC transport system substrate-binding protein